MGFSNGAFEIWFPGGGGVDLGSGLPGTDPISGMGPETGKNRKNAGFGLPQKIEKKKTKTRKNGPKPNFYPFLGHFSYFSANFFLFFGGGRTYIFPTFPGSVPGKQDPKV